MRKLYIDFTHSLPTKTSKSHGGGNYTKTVLLDLIKFLSQNDFQIQVVLLYPSDYEGETEEDKKILSYKKFKTVYLDTDLDKFEFENGSTLFLPLLGVKEFPLLKKIKKKYNVKLILTVHGLRLLDMKWDNYDLNYLNNAKEKMKYRFKNQIPLFARKTIYKHRIRCYIPYCDKLITVSNYSLSFISKFAIIKEVYLQYENIIRTPKIVPPKNTKDQYILFVSGNRIEKNLARTLASYKKIFDENHNVLPLYITGTNESTRTNLSKNLKLSELVYKGKVNFLDYVTNEQLSELYENAAFLLYTSKSEGFGLPALEAAIHTCPSVMAYGTSIPEVLGSNAIYVDPYSVESIAYGIKKMLDPETRENYKQKIEQSIPYIEERINDSNVGLFNFILS